MFIVREDGKVIGAFDDAENGLKLYLSRFDQRFNHVYSMGFETWI